VPLQNAAGDDAWSARMLLIEDITDRVALEEQLQISEKMASIGLLAAGVAHEVNTPLTGISSFTQMLLEAPTRRSEDGAAREDRAADVPRRQDRQRPAQPLAPGRRPTNGSTST
jgi:signal transduction histidine kinase